MEYFYNSRLSLLPDYQNYLNILPGTGTTRADVPESVVSTSTLQHVYRYRIVSRSTNQYQPLINRSLDQFMLRGSHVYLYSYGGNISNDLDVFPFLIDSTINVAASNFGSIAGRPTHTINNSSSLQVLTNSLTRLSADGRRNECDAELKVHNLDISKDPDRTRLKSESRAFKRKAKKPTKSAIRGDPAFRGVSFQLREGKVRLRTCSGTLRRRCRQYSQAISEIAMDAVKGAKSPRRPNDNEVEKKCSSCDTKRTPLWRDAEDGTPLCNACGIRYKKYRIRCVSCWFIPRKGGKAHAKCYRCGNRLCLALLGRNHALPPHIM